VHSRLQQHPSTLLAPLSLSLSAAQGFGIAAKLGNTPGSEFLIGLVGGLVTFGGAYTSIPFIRTLRVALMHW
jgi:hypothetical protein